MVEKNQRDEHFKVRAYGITSVVEMVKQIYILPKEGMGEKSSFLDGGYCDTLIWVTGVMISRWQC